MDKKAKKINQKEKKKKVVHTSKKVMNNTSKKENKRRIRRKIYFSYTQRLIVSCLVFVIAFSFCLYLAINSFEFKHPEKVKYTDTQSIDYKVYLKPNEFYEEEYLGKNMMYVANLIDKISIDFHYKFNIEKPFTMDFDYKIIGELIIANASTKAHYFEKEYTLYESSLITMKDDTNYTINENIDIDYDYYNSLANTFKTNYGVNSESSLKVYLQIHKNGKKYNVDIANTSDNGITIPLSENSVQIKFDSSDLNKENELTIERAWILQPKIFTLEIITFLISTFFLIKIIKMVGITIRPKSPYDKYLSNILKTYDRLIGETKTGIDFDQYTIIEMKTFEELLDIRDNLKIPIMYYNITKHQKCYFYIKNNQDVYLFKLKAIDMEVGNDKKK